jgi:predicted DNA-binding protein
MKNVSNKDVSIALRLSRGMRTELESLAHKNKTSVSNVIRESVNQFINNN